MPIVHMAFALKDIPAGAANVRGSCNVADGSMGQDVIGPRPMWTYETHIGCCIAESESNGSWDSDFYMTVWNAEKQEPERILFASTRGWTYPCLASRVDATPEVVEAYRAWGRSQQEKMKRERRISDARRLRSALRIVREAARKNDVPYVRLLRLRRTLGMDKVVALAKLLDSTRLRSAFKLSLRSQVIAWLRDYNPQYAQPLSKKQMECI